VNRIKLAQGVGLCNYSNHSRSLTMRNFPTANNTEFVSTDPVTYQERVHSVNFNPQEIFFVLILSVAKLNPGPYCF
jgi:hypothetical protein